MCNSNNCSHDDLNDDISDIFGADLGAGVDIDAAAKFAAEQLPERFETKCASCKGSGRFISWAGRDCGPCFKCKGKGVIYTKTDPAVLAERRAKAAEKKAKQAAEAIEQANAWLEANPVEAEWLREPIRGDFTFHADMLAALKQYGSFTERQEAAVRNAAAKSAARKAQWAAEKAEREAGAAVLSMAKIREGFENASQHLKRPKLRIADIQFSLAPANGRNAGCIYVKEGADWEAPYLGKITPEDKFLRSRECSDELAAIVAKVAADPKAAAEAHGHEYGQCSCCGRELTNPESVARGIGPICADRWGW
jgi:hypothetical protein